MNDNENAANEQHEHDLDESSFISNEDFQEYDSTETGEEREETESESDAEQQEPAYYSIEQLENWDEERDGEIDPDLIPPSLSKIASKIAGKSKNDSSFDDKLKEFSEDDEPVIPGLSVDETLVISRDAKRRADEFLRSRGEEFDEYNDEHKEILSEVKRNLTTAFKKQKEEANAIRKLDSMMMSRYGSDYKRIDAEVSRYIDEEMSQSQLRKLKAAIISGNRDIAISLYDMAANRLKGFSNSKPVKRRPIFPPHSISGGEQKRKEKKEITENDLLWEEPEWHRM